eukprot:2533589-Pleurochrysis_carterae.AAC.1
MREARFSGQRFPMPSGSSGEEGVDVLVVLVSVGAQSRVSTDSRHFAGSYNSFKMGFLRQSGRSGTLSESRAGWVRVLGVSWGGA